MQIAIPVMIKHTIMPHTDYSLTVLR